MLPFKSQALLSGFRHALGVDRYDGGGHHGCSIYRGACSAPAGQLTIWHAMHRGLSHRFRTRVCDMDDVLAVVPPTDL